MGRYISKHFTQMGATEAKVYKGNIALAAKRGVFVYFTFTTFTLFFSYSFTIHHTSFIWNILFFLSFLFTHTISPRFLFRAEYPGPIMLGFFVEDDYIFVDVIEVGGRRSAGF